MTVDSSISQAFVKLGEFLLSFCDKDNNDSSLWNRRLQECIKQGQQQNAWFTEENILFALEQWGTILTEENLKDWLSSYKIENHGPVKTIAVIMAGNIPLVGFHDFMCVLLTNNRILAKLSSNDKIMLPFLADFLKNSTPVLEDRIVFTDDKLEGFNAVIATGSNNTGRYFEYYFNKYPSIIRKNRNSVAVISGNESKQELRQLGEDVFTYFGLGCRSVSKLFVPKDYEFSTFYEAIFEYKNVINTTKYANNYDYNKAVYLMSNFNLLDNNFLLLKEDNTYGSPIGTLHFEYYDSLTDLNKRLSLDNEHLQCIVAKDHIKNAIPFGTTQNPSLNDYADGVDTIEFLLKL